MLNSAVINIKSGTHEYFSVFLANSVSLVSVSTEKVGGDASGSSRVEQIFCDTCAGWCPTDHECYERKNNEFSILFYILYVCIVIFYMLFVVNSDDDGIMRNHNRRRCGDKLSCKSIHIFG